MTIQEALTQYDTASDNVETAKAKLWQSATGDDTPVEYALVSLDYSLALADYQSALVDVDIAYAEVH